MGDYEYQRLKELGFHAEAEEYRRLSGIPKRETPPTKICDSKKPRQVVKRNATAIMYALAKEEGITIKPGTKMVDMVMCLKGCGKRPTRKKARDWLISEAARRGMLSGSEQVTQTKAKPKAKKNSIPKEASKGFLNTFEWKQLRYKAIKKHGAKCQLCGATPNDGARINVDHIKPRKKYPELALDINNLQVLCGTCNHGKGNWDETDWRE